MIYYYSKISKRDFLLLIWFFFYLILSIKSYNRHDIIGLIVFVSGLMLFGFMLLPRLTFILYAKILKKPIFTANELYIFDHYRNIKFYWDDIKDVVASDDFLQIQLYEPEKYLDKIKNPFRRVIKFLKYKFSKTKPVYYNINVDMLAIKKGENKKFLDTLNYLSISL